MSQQKLTPLPSDTEAELAVLSACLLAPDALAIVRDVLRPDQLFDPSNRVILSAIYDIDDSGSRVDGVTLASHLRTIGKLQTIGGPARLVEVFDASPDISHAEDHAKIVVDKCRLRKIIDACRLHAATAYGDVGDVADYCNTVERDILAATDPGDRVDAPKTIRELIGEELPKIAERHNRNGKSVEKRAGARTGIYELDQKLCGGLDNNMYIVAGRPGMGKTAFVLGVCRAVAESGKSAVFYSLEMDKEQLARRLLSQESLVMYNALKTGTLMPEEWSMVCTAAERLSKLPISIQYRPGAHHTQARSTMRREFARLEREYGAKPGLAAIDYAQLMKGDRPGGASRDEEVGSISRACMMLPSEFNCPVILLSQLNRDVEKRPNKRPQLSDLRESGSLEQDGYGIFFLYRDEFYNEHSEAKGIAEVIIAKNRNGETGTVECRFDGPCTRFSSLNEQMHKEIDELGDAMGAGDF